MTTDGAGFGWQSWTDVESVRARLDAGADPNAAASWEVPPLHAAAANGTAAVVALLAQAVDDIDELEHGRTALWLAVAAHRPDNARALVAAGADPFLEMMGGWSPARLSLAGPNPDLFDQRTELTPQERAVIEESARLIAVFDDVFFYGYGVACVAGIDAAEAVRRLGAEIVDPDHGVEDEEDDEDEDDYDDQDVDEYGDIYADLQDDRMWVTTVPGGCVITQRGGYEPARKEITAKLSAGTTCYGMYANPKSGNQGSIVRDGEILGSDLIPGGGPGEEDDAGAVLLAHLYENRTLAFCHAFVGLAPTNARAVTGPPDLVVRLP